MANGAIVNSRKTLPMESKKYFQALLALYVAPNFVLSPFKGLHNRQL